jgi:NNP family nitrate/nitrite transporter-like MFS transporter
MEGTVENGPTPRGDALQLAMGTGAFAVCFAVFGSVSAMMPLLKKRLGLSPVQLGAALAVPVLLGSLGRIPLGMFSDRLGARRVFLAVLAASALAVTGVAEVESFPALLAGGAGVGIALASFSVGVGMVSSFYPPEKQGVALGIYGAGNIGQSVAAMVAPLVAGALGFAWGFRVFAVIAAAWLVVFALLARDAPRPGGPRSFSEIVAPLRSSRSWLLSLYYFLTFGGFVAMAVYLPLLLTEDFQLTPADAGLRTAGFVALATVARPLGGHLADRVGGARILRGVFAFTAAMALLLCVPAMPVFTAGALGMAAAIGLGNGAVFKLVPEYFPRSVGSVTGLVGAAGGLGGFFPPLVLGGLRQATGSFTAGFVLLGLFASTCLAVLVSVAPPGAPRHAAA